MAFHVYPDPQLNPRNVAAGATSPLESIVELVGAGAGPFGLDTMFIRLVMLGAGCAPSGAPHPTVILKANTGDEEAISAGGGTVSIFNLPANSGLEVANAVMFAEANGVYRVEVYVFVQGSSWQIRIQNNDGVNAHDFTWVAADTNGEASQPWIDIPDDQDFDALVGQTLTGQSVPLIIQVNNHGTGPLVISDAPGVIGASDFELTAIPGSINPNACGNLGITFNAPAIPGQSAINYTVTSNDTTAVTGNPAAAHNRRVALTATRGRLEAMLLLDTSGSMGYTPGGNLPVADTDSRWGHLKVAAGEFLDLLADFGDGLGRFGVGMFPNITGASYPPAPTPSSADFHAPVDINVPAIQTAKDSLDDFTPVSGGGATPMGHGIGRAIGTTPGSFGYFQSSGNAVQFNQRWLVLMSDGKHNSGPPAPADFYRTIEGNGSCPDPGSAAAGQSFVDKNVTVISVAYGDPALTTFEVDHELLELLACKSGGQFLDAGADDVGMGLLKAFRGAITAGLALDPTVDPAGTLTPAVPEVRRQVSVLPYDTRVSFVVNWGTFDKERVVVQLLTPNCELITPGEAQSQANIVFHGHPRYTIYTFNHDYLRNAGDPANPRYGAWTLIISAQGLEAGESEPYEYEVLTESRLKLKLNFTQGNYYAGDTIHLAASLMLDGKPISNAAVTLNLTRPGSFVNNWLAQTAVTQAEYQESASILAGEDVTAIGIKSHAIQAKGLVFDFFSNKSTIPMPESEQAGIYTASVSNTSVPGTYDFYVTAAGQTEDGVTFRREKRVQVRVGVRPAPDFTLVNVGYAFIRDAEVPFFQAQVRVWPRDRFGNVLLIDPEIDQTIQLVAQGGEFTGPLAGNLDGSYSRPLRFTPGSQPVVSLAVAGEAVVPHHVVAPIDRLRYAERVVAFRPGGEAERGANQHRDPQAALGNPATKDRDAFVSLGAKGLLAVGLAGPAGEQAILAQGEDDITVFVRPDEDLRPYRVEALAVGSRERWVEIGQSAGITQSFSLARANLKAAEAIRIIDQSGRTRDSQFRPSPSPGVSVQGIGFKQLGQPPRGCLDVLLGLLKPAPRARDRVR